MQIDCPECGHHFGVSLVTELEAEHKIGFRIVPKEGHRLSVMHVGGMLRSFERLLSAFGREQGWQTTLVVNRLCTEDDGSVVLEAMVLNAPVPDLSSLAAMQSGET